jgi:hypothetical protein
VPVDLDFQNTWPIFYHEITTTDLTPVTLTLSELPNVGDYCQIPECQVTGTTVSAPILGFTSLAGFTCSHTGGGLVLRTHFNLTAAFGAGGPTIVYGVTATEVQVTITGLAGTTVEWTVYWRLLQRLF